MAKILFAENDALPDLKSALLLRIRRNEAEFSGSVSYDIFTQRYLLQSFQKKTV